MAGKVVDRRYLIVKKYLRLREEGGHDYANSKLTRQENDDLFNYIMSCATPENHDACPEPGGFIIPESL